MPQKQSASISFNNLKYLRLCVKFGIVLISILLIIQCKNDPKSTIESAVEKLEEPTGKIAFTTNRDGNKEIYLMKADGTDLQNVSQHPAMEYGASWSPDSKYLATYSNRNFNPEIYLLNLETDTSIRLTNDGSDDVLPAISPDGKRIAFMSDRNQKSRSLFLMKIDGSEVRALTDNEAYEESPSWSPDGTSLLFTRQIRQETDTTHAANGEIFTLDLSTKIATRVSHKDGYDSGAVYDPKGEKIAFYGPGEQSFDIFTMKRDGSEITNITKDTLDAYSPSWSPDGQWIAYTAGAENNYDIYIIHLETGERRQLTKTKIRNEHPSWQPHSQ